MSDNNDKVNNELRRAVRRAEAEGRAEEILAMIRTSFGPGPDRQGMTDAAKRLRPEDFSDWELASEVPKASSPAGYNDTASSVLGPHVPWRASMASTTGARGSGHNLPDGVSSLDRWGDTLCVLPKVASKKASYKDLVAEAYEDPEMMGYLTNFVMKHNGPSPKVRDLRQYLEAIHFPNRGGEDPVSYLGNSSTVRIYKQ